MARATIGAFATPGPVRRSSNWLPIMCGFLAAFAVALNIRPFISGGVRSTMPSGGPQRRSAGTPSNVALGGGAGDAGGTATVEPAHPTVMAAAWLLFAISSLVGAAVALAAAFLQKAIEVGSSAPGGIVNAVSTAVSSAAPVAPHEAEDAVAAPVAPIAGATRSGSPGKQRWPSPSRQGSKKATNVARAAAPDVWRDRKVSPVAATRVSTSNQTTGRRSNGVPTFRLDLTDS